MIIGVTDEGPELVDGWVADVKPDFPIVILKDKALEDKIGVKFFPTAAVVGPGLKMTYSGSSRDYAEPLEAALKDSDHASLYPKSISKVRKAWGAGETIKAYVEACKVADSGKDETGWAVRFRDFIASEANNALQQAEQLSIDGFVLDAEEAVEPFHAKNNSLPNAADTAKFLKELSADKLYKKEIKGGKLYREAQALAAGYEYTEATLAYKAVMKKYKGTRIADHGASSARKLIEKGMPGYTRHCENCRREKRACAKHFEYISL